MTATKLSKRTEFRFGDASSFFVLRKLAYSLCACVVMLAGCGYPGDVDGPNGYSILSDKGTGCGVHKNGWEGEEVVGPEVDSYAIVNQYIIGHNVAAQDSPPTPNPGFFIVDTLKNKVVTGLGEEGWKQQLSQLGIHNPKLQPSAFESRTQLPAN